MTTAQLENLVSALRKIGDGAPYPIVTAREALAPFDGIKLDDYVVVKRDVVKDAERYRYVRNRITVTEVQDLEDRGSDLDGEPYEVEIDKAIDIAIAAAATEKTDEH